MRETVCVAMSGGVDSSLAASLLIEQGYNVFGITMQLWSPVNREQGFISAVEDARKVAKHLGIPHYTCDFKDVFQNNVINYFCQEYLDGHTPNPCVACNRKIKFGVLFDRARQLGADYLSTGHFARVAYDEERRRWVLKKGLDKKKDQSYVLYNLRQDQLPYLKFPLGEYNKDEVRKIAVSAGLPVAQKKESQEICFIPDNDYRRFLKERIPQAVEPGPVFDIQGNYVGEHQGLAFYTIGQRHGLGLSLGYPAYVVELDTARNALVVGKKEDLLVPGLTARDLNFIALESLEADHFAQVKIRYNFPPAEAVISPGEDGEVLVHFSKPQKAVTPGQAVVFYQDDLVLGGGTIANRCK